MRTTLAWGSIHYIMVSKVRIDGGVSSLTDILYSLYSIVGHHCQLVMGTTWTADSR